jgi:hypothetical protein
VHAVEGNVKAAKLPRVGSRLNASKPESELVSGDPPRSVAVSVQTSVLDPVVVEVRR